MVSEAMGKKSSLQSQQSGGTHSGSSSNSSDNNSGGAWDAGRRRGWSGAGVIPSEYIVPVHVRSRRVFPVWLCPRRWLVLRGAKTPVLAVYRKVGDRLELDGDVADTAPLRVMALGMHTRVRAVGEKTLELATSRARRRSDTWVLTFDSSAQRRRVYELVKTWTELGEFLGQLTAIERVARSHNSTVYKCQSRSETAGSGGTARSQRFALKRVLAARCASELAVTERVAAIPALRPYLARYLVMFEDASSAGSVTIVMKYYGGGSLSDRIRETGPLSERAARGVLASLCCALFLLHVNGVLHLDVKAANVLFDSGEGHPRGLRNLKLVDFGSGVLLGKEQEQQQQEEKEHRGLGKKTSSRQPAGTYGCMAPERFDGCVGPESDVYGAGVVLHHMLVGHAPFVGRDSYQVMARNMRGDVNFDSSRWASVSPPLRQLARRMLDKDPDTRVTLPEILTMAWLFQETAPPAAIPRAMFA